MQKLNSKFKGVKSGTKAFDFLHSILTFDF